MKKCWVVLLVLLLLTGCGQPKAYETVMDSGIQEIVPEKLEIVVNLPSNASQTVMTMDSGEKLYFCDNYTMCLQTVEAGDLQKTVLSVCGFYPDQLPVMETVQSGDKRYDFVWTSVGENGDQVGRCAIIDDGSYHYIVSTMADASETGDLTQGAWREIYNSFRIVPAEEIVSSGS